MASSSSANAANWAKQIGQSNGWPAPRLASLTGLRWMAALLVFLHHLVDYVPENAFGRAWARIFDPGFAGVSFFFVLSGFVLAWSHQQGDRPSAFYRRRFARIAPVYWAALLIVTLGRALTPPKGGPLPILRDAIPSLAGVQAWFPSEAIHFGGNSVEWSVSAEVFFYATFPALIWAFRRARIRVVLVSAAAVTVLLVPILLRPTGQPGVSTWIIYILPAQRLAEFILGVGLAWAMRSGRRFGVPVPLATAFAVGAYVLAGFAPYWAQVALVTLVPFSLLIASAARADLGGKTGFLGTTIMRRLGELSFSFYLIHLFVITSTFFVVERFLPGVLVFAVAAPVALVGALASAAVLYHLVEKPLEKRLRHARPRPEMLAD